MRHTGWKIDRHRLLFLASQSSPRESLAVGAFSYYCGPEMADGGMDGRYFLSYEHIHLSVRALAERIREAGFHPDLIVAIGSGGFIPARILKTFMEIPIFTVGISYYGPDNKPGPAPRAIQWIDEVEKKLAGRRILLVDEVDDSRVTLEYCLRELLQHAPAEIAVAVLHNKKKEKKGSLPPEVRRYFAGEELDDKWICYPWDARDITAHEKIARSGIVAH